MSVASLSDHVVLTDIVATDMLGSGTQAMIGNIYRGTTSCTFDADSLVMRFKVPPDETLSVNLTTGIAFEPGEKICFLAAGGGGSVNLDVSFLG